MTENKKFNRLIEYVSGMIYLQLFGLFGVILMTTLYMWSQPVVSNLLIHDQIFTIFQALLIGSIMAMIGAGMMSFGSLKQTKYHLLLKIEGLALMILAAIIFVYPVSSGICAIIGLAAVITTVYIYLIWDVVHNKIHKRSQILGDQ